MRQIATFCCVVTLTKHAQFTHLFIKAFEVMSLGKCLNKTKVAAWEMMKYAVISICTKYSQEFTCVLYMEIVLKALNLNIAFNMFHISIAI